MLMKALRRPGNQPRVSDAAKFTVPALANMHIEGFALVQEDKL